MWLGFVIGPLGPDSALIIRVVLLGHRPGMSALIWRRFGADSKRARRASRHRLGVGLPARPRLRTCRHRLGVDSVPAGAASAYSSQVAVPHAVLMRPCGCTCEEKKWPRRPVSSRASGSRASSVARAPGTNSFGHRIRGIASAGISSSPGRFLPSGLIRRISGVRCFWLWVFAIYIEPRLSPEFENLGGHKVFQA
jgi:hypothetical protein